jgi:hypothetical protein
VNGYVVVKGFGGAVDMVEKCSEDLTQAEEQREKLLRFDDVKLKERAAGFREFLDVNNEKATKAFCKLSKEGGINDDISQIKTDDGVDFGKNKERGEHIRKYYEQLYKRRLDTLLSVEGFLEEAISGEEWVLSRKLNMEERNSLEGEVTIEELKGSLDTSNFESSEWVGRNIV